MTELIKIEINENNEQLINARELYNFLEIKKDFSDWIKQMIDYGFVEDLDFTTFLGKTSNNGGRPKKEYFLKIDMAKEIAMIQRSEKGKKARAYFIECEKKLKENNNLTLEEMTKLVMIGLNERIEEQQKKINLLEHNNLTFNSTEIAKELGLKSANELNKILSDNNIIYRSRGTWVLYSNYSNLGYQNIKEKVLDNGKVIYYSEWTSEGRSFIIDLIGLEK